MKLTQKLTNLVLSLLMMVTLIPASTMSTHAASDPVIIDDNNSAITYSAGNANNGGWGSWGQDKSYTESEHWSNSANATLKFKFTGTKLELYGKKDPSHAKFSVSIDGGEATKHDEYRVESKANALIYTSEALPTGEHEVVLKVLNERNPSSTGSGSVYGIQFSYAKVFNDPVMVETIINDHDTTNGALELNKFKFSASPNDWGTSEGLDASFNCYNGDEHWVHAKSNKAPTFELKFKGSKIEVYGKKEASAGYRNWQIDDMPVEKLSAYATSNSMGVVYSKEGLSDTEHVLKCTVLYEHPEGSSGYSAQIDYAKAYSEKTGPAQQIVTTVDDSDTTLSDELFKIKYEGAGWHAESDPSYGFLNGTDHYSDNDTASYSMKFIGNKIELIASKNTNHSDYTIYIDGAEVGTANAHLASGNTVHQQVLFMKDNLTEGEHTIKVAIKAGFTASIQADAFRVTHAEIKATGLVFAKDNLRIENGASEIVTASYVPSCASGDVIEYSTDDADIASVKANGEVTGLKVGNTNLVAKIKGTSITKSIPVVVVPEGLPLKATISSKDKLYMQDKYDLINNMNQTSFKDTAWLGDEISSQISMVSNNKGAKNVTVTSTDFISGENKISKSNVDIQFLKTTIGSTGKCGSGTKLDIPDIIYSSDAQDLAGLKVKNAWVNIKIPKNAKPGTYTGTISVKADKLTTPIDFDYTIEVLDLVQPNVVGNFNFELWTYPYTVARYYNIPKSEYFGEKHNNILKNELKEYKEAGGDVITTSIVENPWADKWGNHGAQTYDITPSMIKWTKHSDNSFTYDFTEFDKWVQLNLDMGIDGRIKCFSIIPWKNQLGYYDEANQLHSMSLPVGDETIWRPFLVKFVEHLDQKGWFDKTYLALDEVSASEMNKVLDLIESVKNKDNNHLKLSACANYEVSGVNLDRVDDIAMQLTQTKGSTLEHLRDLAAHRRTLGLTTNIYTCTGDYPSSFATSDPAESAWTMWYTAGADMDGYVRWAYDAWVKDPLNDTTHWYWESGDPFLVYPDAADALNPKTHSTPRFERMKEGLRDVAKMKWLQKNGTAELRDSITASMHSVKLPGDRELASSETQRMREATMNASKQYIATRGTLVQSITVGNRDVSLKKGANATIETTIAPVTATNKELSFASDHHNVATVSDTGVITAVGKGVATITITSKDGNASTTINVTVRDDEALTEVIKDANLIEENAYTKDSYAALLAAIAQADLIIKNDVATQAEIDAAMTALNNVISSLVGLNRNELTKALKEVNKLVKNDYTSDSWSALMLIQSEAEKLMKEASLNQSD
ncbi:MAG: DUF6067 family protein, partial [Erysipelotrichaceae bacterium]